MLIMEGDTAGVANNNGHVENRASSNDGNVTHLLLASQLGTVSLYAGSASVQMDVRGQESGTKEKSIVTNLQEEKMETEVILRNSDNSCVVKSDSSEGVKVSDADCGTGGGESVKSDSGDAVMTEGVKDAEKEGEGVARSEEEKKLWAAVQANPADFTSWTTLLQTVEQKVRIWSLEAVCKMTSVPKLCVPINLFCVHTQCVSVLSPLHRVCWTVHVRCSVNSSASIRTVMATGRSTQTLSRGSVLTRRPEMY